MSFTTWRAFGVDGLLVFEARAGESRGVREIRRFVLFPSQTVKGIDGTICMRLRASREMLHPMAIGGHSVSTLNQLSNFSVMTVYSCDFPI